MSLFYPVLFTRNLVRGKLLPQEDVWGVMRGEKFFIPPPADVDGDNWAHVAPCVAVCGHTNNLVFLHKKIHPYQGFAT